MAASDSTLGWYPDTEFLLNYMVGLIIMHVMPEKIRIATFNVFYAKNYLIFADAIKQNTVLNGADIILFQEIEAYPEEGRERAQHIAWHLGMHYIYVPARDTDLGGTHGLAILSKYPIIESELIPLPFFNIHRHSRTRIAVNAIIDVNGKHILVSNVHLDTRLNINERTMQLGSLMKKIEEHQIKDVIIGGDFNTIPFRWAFRLMPYFYANQRKQLAKYFAEHNFQATLDRSLPTFASRFLRWSLDAIYSKNFDVLNAGVETNVKMSDHYPVWTDLAL